MFMNKRYIKPTAGKISELCYHCFQPCYRIKLGNSPSFLLHPSLTLVTPPETSCTLLHSLMSNSFLISSLFLLSLPFGATVKSSFLGMESPCMRQTLCRTIHASVAVQTCSLSLSFFRNSTLHLPFN